MPNIAVLPGDCIGPEIMNAALEIFKAAQQVTNTNYTIQSYPFGGAAIDAVGEPLPASTLAGAKAADAVLLAAIGGPKWNDAKERPEAGLLKIRKSLNLFANIRPTKITPGMVQYSPLKPDIAKNTDFVIVRELTSGIYFGQPRRLGTTDAVDTSHYTEAEIKRILEVAFTMAQHRQKHVTVVDKANVLATSKLWRQVAATVAPNYPDVTMDFEYVDAAAMKIVSNPTKFDVIATSNLFGDILSDEAAAITGSIGTIPSESRGIAGPNLYEPIHGSAPDIAGKGIANPIAMINSVVMMLTNTFHDTKTAGVIQNALNQTIEAGTLTPDFGGNATTAIMTTAIIKAIEATKEPAYVKTTNDVR
ncbi:MAG: 3-isopropylmalate dehydrogenase [Lactobacillus sp.]|jgi:3-isopropylmalate dehydrogenase|nr:3-isopropylmalate dehydrogenase [Lactobacillus sp.]